tara:strand:- start:401 stop:904 length:504 start_codon:yes stop_codon:yes gene_type:complete
MKNKTLTVLATAFLFTGCFYTKVMTSDVSVAPAKFTLTVINDTDSPMKWAQTWAMTGPDSGIVAAGKTVALSSNEIGGDVITITPVPPKKVKSPNPQNGTFQMTYGWDGHIARVYADNIKNNGSPTKGVHYYGCNWIYATKWLKPSGVQTNTSNTVTFTTEPFPGPE